MSQTDWPPWIEKRWTSVSAVELALKNDGLIADEYFANLSGVSWPRGSTLTVSYAPWSFSFACLKANRPLVSSTLALRSWTLRPSEFSQFVPGTVGDIQARPDTVFGGPGWKYSAEGAYGVYASTDYDARGVDISGNNNPDWPIRLVDGRPAFVRDVTERASFKPHYDSDEDMFCVVKDTDTRADLEYEGPDSDPQVGSIPIGLEIRIYLYSWRDPPLDNAIILRFDVTNASGTKLDSCFFGIGVRIGFDVDGSVATIGKGKVELYAGDPGRSLLVQYSPDLARIGNDPPFQPHVGLSCLASPNACTGTASGISVSRAQIETWFDPRNSDSVRYRQISLLPGIDGPYEWPFGLNTPWWPPHFVGTGPFRLDAGDSASIAFGVFFAAGRDALLRLNEVVHRVYESGLTPPAAPSQPQLAARSVDGGVSLSWDDAAEKSVDLVIPDTLGLAFMGYRLYRSWGASGPFVRIKEWQLGRDSIVHEYEDRGQDGVDLSIPPDVGLRNNIAYFYRLTAYDEGIPTLGVPPMESEALTVAGVPETEPSSPFSLDEVRVVPNPYIVEHAGQRSVEDPKVYFTSLPEECTISIFTVGLDLVSRLEHNGGSSEVWDLRTQGGQRVASQLFLALIQTPQGTSVTRKFSVVIAE